MICVIYKGKNTLLPQNGVEYRIGVDNLSKSNYVLLMDEGWDFISDISLYVMLNYLEQLGIFRGVYSDCLVNNIYKNNMAYDSTNIQIEKVMGPVLFRAGQFDINGKQEDILRTAYPFFRIPELLFKYSD